MKKKRAGGSLWKRRPEVIERVIRHKIFSYSDVMVRRRIRKTMDHAAERKRLKALEAAFKEVKNAAIRLEYQELSITKQLFNVALYLLLIERDIAAIKWDALVDPNPWRRSLFTRTMLLTLYETKIGQVTGKEFVDALEELQVDQDLKDRAKRSIGKINKTHAKIVSHFNDARKTMIAHRQPDALAQYRAIRNLRSEPVFKLGSEFYEGIEKFLGVLLEVIAEAESFKGRVRQVARSLDSKK